MAKIFISYRRADSIVITGRIYDRLVQAFGKNAIFKDLENIGAGVDFRDVLRKAAAECNVMLVIIGPNWVNASDGKGNLRLNDPNDFVRLEVEMGLERDDVLVVPVLVSGAPAPQASELPDSLQELAFNNARPVRNDPDFHPDMNRLIEELRGPLKRPHGSDGASSLRKIIPIALIAVVALIGLFAFLTAQKPQDLTAATSTSIVTQEVAQLAATAEPLIATAEPSAAPTEEPAVATAAPTAEATPSPEDIALIPVTQNADWAAVERDFNGVTMVLVPAGCFMMGDTDFADEKAPHEQCFDKPFWIDQYEVTNAQFDTLKGVAAKPSRQQGANSPRDSITWAEAQAFCTLREAHLPTEKEWEYAASGPSNWEYTWGEDWNSSNLVWSANSLSRSADVGSSPNGKSWVGAQDMLGNVWDMVSSVYKKYPYDDTDDREVVNPDAEHVLRGGSWDNNFQGNFRTAARVSSTEVTSGNAIGFRCARPA